MTGSWPRPHGTRYAVMAYIVIAQIAMAHIAMAHIVMAYIAIADDDWLLAPAAWYRCRMCIDMCV